MKIGARPTDEQILAALNRAAGGSCAATYVVRNWLADKEYGGFDDMNTSHVLYRLKKMEQKGIIRRALRSFYSGLHAEWEIV